MVAIFGAIRKFRVGWWLVAFHPIPKRHSWGRPLGHLEGDAAAMADDLGADLDQFLLQARQRPVLDRFGRRQRAQEIAEHCRPAHEAGAAPSWPQTSCMT